MDDREGAMIQLLALVLCVKLLGQIVDEEKMYGYLQLVFLLYISTWFLSFTRYI